MQLPAIGCAGAIHTSQEISHDTSSDRISCIDTDFRRANFHRSRQDYSHGDSVDCQSRDIGRTAATFPGMMRAWSASCPIRAAFAAELGHRPARAVVTAAAQDALSHRAGDTIQTISMTRPFIRTAIDHNGWQPGPGWDSLQCRLREPNFGTDSAPSILAEPRVTVARKSPTAPASKDATGARTAPACGSIRVVQLNSPSIDAGTDASKAWMAERRHAPRFRTRDE